MKNQVVPLHSNKGCSCHAAGLALAVDLGTTTLTGSLMSASGDVLAGARTLNPQQRSGSDILTRLERAHGGEGNELQSLLVDGLRTVIAELIDVTGCSMNDIDSVAFAGNPGMSCMLRNLPVDQLLVPPHKPPYKELMRIPPGELGLGPTCSLELLPLVSGFVGGDLVACLLALGQVAPGTLIVDLGTNAEIALWDGKCWWVTSAAAGPAFEGGNISTGMIHTPGAVTDVTLIDDRFELVVAGGGLPRGLCGSGLTSLVAAALEGELVGRDGRIRAADEVETNLTRYLTLVDGEMAIRFYYSATNELVLTQQDLRSFQLAKGAVRAGVSVLLERCNLKPEQVAGVSLTGALGANVSPEALKRVALLPEPMLDKTSFMEDGVLVGLRSYLMNNKRHQTLDALMRKVQPFPLSGTPAFEKYFLSSLDF